MPKSSTPKDAVKKTAAPKNAAAKAVAAKTAATKTATTKAPAAKAPAAKAQAAKTPAAKPAAAKNAAPKAKDKKAAIPPSNTSHLFGGRKPNDRGAVVTSERIADDMEAFRKAGGRVEVLGNTRVLTRIDEPVPKPASNDRKPARKAAAGAKSAS